MAISYVGATTANNGGGVGLNLTLPAGLQQGDVVYVSARDAGPVGSTGWTLIASESTWWKVYRKVMGATPDSSISLDANGGNTANTSAVAVAFRGVDNTTPEDVAVVVTTSSDAGSATPATGSNWSLVMASGEGNTSSCVPPSGYTLGAAIGGTGTMYSNSVAAYYNSTPGSFGVARDPAAPSWPITAGTGDSAHIILRAAGAQPPFVSTNPAYFTDGDGSGANTTLAVGVSSGTSVTAVAGSFLIATVKCDRANDTASGETNFITNFADNAGGSNNWQKAGEYTYDAPGSGNASVTVAVFFRYIATSGQAWTTATSVTATFSSAAANRFISVLRAAVTAEPTLYWVSYAGSASTDLPAMTISGLTAREPGYLVLRLYGSRASTDNFASNTSGWTGLTATGTTNRRYDGEFIVLDSSSTGATSDPTASNSGPGVSVALAFSGPITDTVVTPTGVSGTGSVGSLGITRDKAVTGNAGTSAVGTMVITKTVALTGVSASGAVGAVVAQTGNSVTLTGVVATATPGSVRPTVTKVLTGSQLTGSVGNVARGFSMSGAAASGAVGSVGLTRSVALTGVSATGAAGSVSGNVELFQAYRMFAIMG